MRLIVSALQVPVGILLAFGAEAAEFTPLGDLAGGDFYSTATDVSDDGSVVVGFSSSGPEAIEAYRWTAATGMVGLGDFPGGFFRSRARGVSADGGVVIGMGSINGDIRPFLWTSAGGMARLGDIAGGDRAGDAGGVSADGSVVVGGSNSEAYRWTASTGWTGLGDLPGGRLWSSANGVSADGSVVVGWGTSLTGGEETFEAMRWTSATGTVGLGDLAGGSFDSRAHAVSADGGVIVGWGTSGSGIEACLWTAGTGPVGLGDLPGGTFRSWANGVSADGSIVVGESESASGNEAFVWTQNEGMQSLYDQLLAHGATGLEGWQLRNATAISADGQWVVGGGINPSGDPEGYLAHLPELASVDTDGDGVADAEDAFPEDPEEWADTDHDGTGDNADTDDDNDGIADASDPYPFGQFTDAGPTFWAFQFVEALGRSGITSGCGDDRYCPDEAVTRAQMAVFLERGMNGSEYSPPAAVGNVFLDVGAGDFAAAFVEQLFLDGITGGCGGNNYCPGNAVTRAQMAIFLLRAKHGAGYQPPAPAGAFDDVDLAYWAASWIEQLAAEGITSGCGDGNYCPEQPVTRAQMAVFLVRTFDL